MQDLNDQSVLPELYFLIAHFLSNGPYKESAKKLIEQLEANNEFPQRIDWTGNGHPRSFSEMALINSNIQPNFLLKAFNQIMLLYDQYTNDFSRMKTLLGAGQYSIFQDIKKLELRNRENKTSNLSAMPKHLWSNYAVSEFLPATSRINKPPGGNMCSAYSLSRRSLNGNANLLLNIEKRHMSGRLDPLNLVQSEFYGTINVQKRVFGHLASIYCVLIDRSGRYIFTGADDNLIKVWSVADGRLLATLRGHDKEISDMDINFENTLLATGSCDKTIRVWNLRTTETVAVLQAHASMITSVEFCPQSSSTSRWLASSSSDGTVCFWQWNSQTLVFNPKPRKFIEKSRAGTQILCISFSPGGLMLATGSSDNMIRIYLLRADKVEKVFELETHKNVVDSIQYANNSLRFVSGSKDGMAHIWKYEHRSWNIIKIDASKTINMDHQADSSSHADSNKKNSISMVTWNCDDSLVITSQGSFLVKVWNSNDGQLIHELKGHESDVYVLEAHPEDPRLLLSGGNEGFLFLWNIMTGKMIKKFVNKSANEDPGWIFDTKWSPNLDMFASTDSSGHLVIFGFGSDDNYKNTPVEQFFHTDYRPLMRDQNDYVVDEQTQQLPHLMPPPFLVDADGNPYSAEYQRLVPGRGNSPDAALNPQVIVNERGIPEIVFDNNQAQEQDSDDPDEPNGVQARRFQWVKDMIRPLESGKLSASERTRNSQLEEEEKYYNEHHYAKGGPTSSTGTLFRSSSAANDDRAGAKRRRRRNGIESSGNYYVDRLNFRALYDSDHEGEVAIRVINNHDNIVNSVYDEDTRDNYVDVMDEDSNTMLSVGLNFPPSSSNNNNSNSNTNDGTNQSAAGGSSNAASSSRRNNAASDTGRSSRAALNARLVESDHDEMDSSEYSDWAPEEPQREATRPTTSRSRKRTKKQTRQTRRGRREDEEDEDEEEDADDSRELGCEHETLDDSAESRAGRKTRSKRRKLVSDDDEEEASSPESKADEDEEVISKSRKTAKSNVLNETNESDIGRKTRSKRTKMIVSDEDEDEPESDVDDEEDDDEEDEENDDDDETFEDDDEYEPMESDKPCTSHAANARSSNRPKRSRPQKAGGAEQRARAIRRSLNKSMSAGSISRGSKTSKSSSGAKVQSKGKVLAPGEFNECPPDYRPPEWLTSTKPRKSPYVPQMGDEVVYFRQGHELYVEAVKQNNLYEIDDGSLPWTKHKIGAQEFCKVVGLKIEIKPPRLVCLKLNALDPTSNKPTNLTFSIKFHDMPHVVDFVVLRQFYERGMEREWRAKDRFRCIIDDFWWSGTIEAQRPYQHEYPDSPFQSLSVLWDTGETEELSPWDLEPLSSAQSRKSKSSSSASLSAGAGVAVSSEELKSLLYQPEEGEWPGEGRDSECDRIQAGLIKIMELSVAEAFNFPVDLDSFPTYAMQINYPIDLNTIRGRLENRYYRRLNSVQWDIRNIETNAIKFNEPHSLIVQNATLLVELLNEFVSDVHCSNPLPIYKRLCKSKKLSPAGPSSSRLSNKENNSSFESDHGRYISTRTRRSTNFSGNKYSGRNSGQSENQTSKTYAKRQTYTLDGWINQCQKLLKDIMNDEDSEPFREPVDLVEFPDYVGIVETPIDFGTIGEKLRNGLYESIEEFDADCKMLFKNSRLYNTNKRSAIYAITMRLQGFYEERIQQVYENHKAALKQKNHLTSRYGREIKSRFNDSTLRLLTLDPNLDGSVLGDYYESLTATGRANDKRRSGRSSTLSSVPERNRYSSDGIYS